MTTDINERIATEIMGWEREENVWWNDGHYVCEANDFRPFRDHNDFHDAVERLTPGQKARMAVLILYSSDIPYDPLSLLTAPLSVKCRAMLAAVETIGKKGE